jgi:hypothetical protein
LIQFLPFAFTLVYRGEFNMIFGIIKFNRRALFGFSILQGKANWYFEMHVLFIAVVRFSWERGRR